MQDFAAIHSITQEYKMAAVEESPVDGSPMKRALDIACCNFQRFLGARAAALPSVPVAGGGWVFGWLQSGYLIWRLNWNEWGLNGDFMGVQMNLIDWLNGSPWTCERLELRSKMSHNCLRLGWVLCRRCDERLLASNSSTLKELESSFGQLLVVELTKQSGVVSNHGRSVCGQWCIFYCCLYI